MKLKWALNSATIMHSTWDEELLLWEKYGWTAAEVWHSKMDPKVAAGVSYETLARQMSDAGVTSIGTCAVGIAPGAPGKDRTGEFDDLARRLDATAAIGAPALTVITMGELGDDLAAEYDNLIDPLRKASELAAERGLKLNLEFLGGLPINGTLGSGIELVNRVDHPAMGLLFDLCHYYVSASHLEEIETLAPGKLFMIHVDDSPKVPMERLRNDQRCFPGEGRIDVPGILKYLQDKAGYDDYFTFELYDPEQWKLPPDVAMTKIAESIKYVEDKLDQLN